MTDTAPEQTPTLTEVLVRHAIYNHHGISRIAIMDNTLQDLVGTDTFQVTPGEVTLLEVPGSPEWVDRMVRARRNAVQRMVNAENLVLEKTDYIQRLGEALLEEAERRGWCSEYDEFAEEWDLPRMARDYEVTMVVTVKARTEEDAVELVRNHVSIDRWSTEGIDEDPEYTASEA